MPPEQWRRFATDDEAEAMLPDPSLQDPVAVGMMFCNALDDPKHYLNALRNLSTPESVPDWGDYTRAAEALKAVPNRGYGSMVNPSEGDKDVVYFKILPNVESSYQVLDDQPMMMGELLTIVWRKEYNQWMVHAMGDYMRPEHVPH